VFLSINIPHFVTKTPKNIPHYLPKHLILNKKLTPKSQNHKKKLHKTPKNNKNLEILKNFAKYLITSRSHPLLIVRCLPSGGLVSLHWGGLRFLFRAFCLLACVVGLGLFGFGMLPCVGSWWWGGW